IVYVGSNDDKLYAINATNGTEIWSYTTGSDVRSSPIIADGIVYVGSNDNKLYAFTNGQQDLQPPEVSLVSPANDTLYNTTNSITINVSAFDWRGLENCTLWINESGWIANDTHNLTGQWNSSTWNLPNLAKGTYLWNAQCCDNSSNCAFNQTNYTFTINSMPTIYNESLFPPLLYADENLTWQANISDLVELSDVWYSVINSTNVTLYTKSINNTMGVRNESYNTTGLDTGNYRILLYANDTLNNTVNTTLYFEIADSINVSIYVLNATGNSTNATLRLYYNGTNSQRLSAENETLNSTIPEGLWKLVLESIGLNITMDNVNITNITRLGNVSFNDNISTSSFSASAVNAILRALKKIVSAETTFNFTIGQVIFSYDDTGMNENYVSVWVCHDWNLTTDFCNGVWENVTSNSTINTTSNIVQINTTQFSSFTVAQDKYCGDGTCDSGLEDCSSCSTDCGACISNPPGSSSPSGGGAPPSKTKKMEIITTNETLNATIQKAISIPLKNTGETNLTNVTVDLESDCVNCSFSKTLFIFDRINVNDSVLISFSALFNEEGTYDIILTGNSSEGATLNASVTITVGGWVVQESARPSCNYNGVCEPELGEDKNCPDCSKPKICIQVITPAKNPETGECIEYPTPCDVPQGWIKVDVCEPEPPETEKDYTILYLILAIVIILVAVFVIIKVRHDRNIIASNNPFV
ncbi:MAG: PQQ-binding-like beta-propeller repeat protein, partial [Candidatus Aenigmarchaeota archaeon]|nr:PQQ-binding-like beta-propeller repeat protein [Candidatus Aenigmarchaeota archaeon]